MRGIAVAPSFVHYRSPLPGWNAPRVRTDVIRFACPGCRHKVHVPATAAGRTGRCPRCHTRCRVPSASAATPKPRPITRRAAYPDPWLTEEDAALARELAELEVSDEDLRQLQLLPPCNRPSDVHPAAKPRRRRWA